MPRPVVVIARFTARPDNAATLRSLLQGMLAPTREEPGCDRYDLYQVSQGDEFVLVERYRDELALQHHRTTDHYLNYRAHLDVLLASPISVTVLATIDER